MNEIISLIVAIVVLIVFFEVLEIVDRKQKEFNKLYKRKTNVNKDKKK